MSNKQLGENMLRYG